MFRRPLICVIMILLIAGVWGRGLAQEEQTVSQLQGKKVVMILPTQEFDDEELLVPQRMFEEQGIEVTIASSRLEEAQGVSGARITPDILLDNVQAEYYDAVIFVGGSGAAEYWEDPKAHALAQSALDAGKLVCAICIAPVTLAKAGILVGKRATVAAFGALLEEEGAVNTGGAVEVDGNIITANCWLYSSGTAEGFAQAILEALRSQPATVVSPSPWGQVKSLFHD